MMQWQLSSFSVSCCDVCKGCFIFCWILPSGLWHCWLGGRKGIRPVKKTEWWDAGMVIWLERRADLHMAQRMPLPLTVFCFSKIQIGFSFLVPAHLGSPRQRAVKRVCVWILPLLCSDQWYLPDGKADQHNFTLCRQTFTVCPFYWCVKCLCFLTRYLICSYYCLIYACHTKCLLFLLHKVFWEQK